jgi:SAM-dependent methyltransferase
VNGSQSAHNADAFGARDYDLEFPSHRHRARLLGGVLRRLGPFARGADVGCFGGAAAGTYMAGGIAELHGFDIAEASLDACRSRGHEAWHWDASVEPFPGECGTYDVVIASEMIEHVDDTEHALREFRAALRPHGLLLLTTPNLAFWYSRLRLLAGRPPLGAPGVARGRATDAGLDPLHARIGTLSEWRGLIESCGFEILEVAATSYLQADTYPRQWLARLDRWISRRPALGGNLVIVARAV